VKAVKEWSSSWLLGGVLFREIFVKEKARGGDEEEGDHTACRDRSGNHSPGGKNNNPKGATAGKGTKKGIYSPSGQINWSERTASLPRQTGVTCGVNWKDQKYRLNGFKIQIPVVLSSEQRSRSIPIGGEDS